MNEEWLYLVKKYTEGGARSKFEDICSSLFKKKFIEERVKGVKVSGGDGGIDIFVGEIGKTPIHVVYNGCHWASDFGDNGPVISRIIGPKEMASFRRPSGQTGCDIRAA